MIGVYDTTTRLGAYLSDKRHFNPNGLVGFMALEKLEQLNAVVDSSGQYENRSDTLLTINGCLSTTDKWNAFDGVWQAYLKNAGFKRHCRSQEYVFHTTDFWADKCSLMPCGLTDHQKKVIYKDLLQIVRDHVEYCFGYAVVLDHYRACESEFPDNDFGHPGIILSMHFFTWNSNWAEKSKKFSPTIAYTYDQDDRYFPELNRQWKEYLERHPNEEHEIHDMTEGNKARYSPLQAADIVASECRQFFLKKMIWDDDGNITAQIPSRYEMRIINVPGKSDFRLLTKEHLLEQIRQPAMNVLRERNVYDDLVGDGKPYAHVDEIIREWHRAEKEEEDAK